MPYHHGATNRVVGESGWPSSLRGVSYDFQSPPLVDKPDRLRSTGQLPAARPARLDGGDRHDGDECGPVQLRRVRRRARLAVRVDGERCVEPAAGDVARVHRSRAPGRGLTARPAAGREQEGGARTMGANLKSLPRSISLDTGL